MADVQNELKNGHSVLINDSTCKRSTPNSGLLHESLMCSL